MIGKEVYYIEYNGVVKSPIVSMRQEDSGVFVTLESGAAFWLKDCAFSMQELFSKLSKEFLEREQNSKVEAILEER